MLKMLIGAPRACVVFLLVHIVLVAALPAAAEEAGAETRPILEATDCLKCHLQAPRDIDEAGKAHQTAVSCLDCHDGHPPVAWDIIPACSQCHSGNAHFELEQCLSCHDNPHRPLEISIGQDVTDACLTCHDTQGEQLQQHQSFHSSLSCSSCHERKHGVVPECMQCHQAHSEEMVQADCGKCHQAHKPLVVTYSSDLPSATCGSCHGAPMETLSNTVARHGKLNCALCHENEHGAIPSCNQCHQPHSESMDESACSQCHDAHSPVPVVYDDVASSQCAACHEGTYERLTTSRTGHQELSCSMCHAEQHGSIPECSQCHEPHSADMTQADCAMCHQAHEPMPVAYGEETPSLHCASCHAAAYDTLSASEAMHSELACAVCHEDEHKNVPRCRDCHGQPHSKAMLSRFEGCGDCHGTAHDVMR